MASYDKIESMSSYFDEQIKIKGMRGLIYDNSSNPRSLYRESVDQQKRTRVRAGVGEWREKNSSSAI